VFVSGQGALSADGAIVGAGDFEAQTRQVFENLSTVLEQAGGALGSIVKLTVYLTEIANVRDFGRIKAEYLPGPQPASTAVGVTALALPEMMIEVEAFAVL
jgi:enamine deaminase RidA (YjgF/YER057c/UK114 family)